jgi:PhnB protein
MTNGIFRRRFVASAISAATLAALPIRSVAGGQVQKTKGENMTKLMPYLLFDGTCREAMVFYQSCLGGELTLTKVKDSPAKDQMSAAQQDKVLNAHLSAGQMEISASDWLALNETPVRGSTVCLFLGGGTFQDLKTVFDKLSQGADVTNPLKEVFFGVYGALNDKFGVRWMFQTNRQDG